MEASFHFLTVSGLWLIWLLSTFDFDEMEQPQPLAFTYNSAILGVELKYGLRFELLKTVTHNEPCLSRSFFLRT